MKKTLTIISIILVFFLIYFLQANFFTWFNIAGIMPNLYVILVLFIGLFMKRKLRTSPWNCIWFIYRHNLRQECWNISISFRSNRNIR